MVTTTDDPRQRIVEAAAALLHDHGAAALTTRGVAQAAGVQAPTIYRLFGDKDGLLDALAEHVMATYVAARATAVPTDADPVDQVRAGNVQEISSQDQTIEGDLKKPASYTPTGKKAEQSTGVNNHLCGFTTSESARSTPRSTCR